MSQLANDFLELFRASQVLSTAARNLPSLTIGSPEARKAKKEMQDSLETIQLKVALIFSGPLPATHPTTNRARWECNIRHDIPKLEEMCRDAQRIALDGQAAWPKDWAKTQADIFDITDKINDCSKRILALGDAIVAAPDQAAAADPGPVPAGTAPAGAAVAAAPESEPAATFAEDDWITLAEAKAFSSIPEGTISRAATRGKIKDNGITRKGRRLHAGSFMRWLKQKPSAEGESNAQVQKLVDKHCKD